jgi:hypothetical protein
MPGGPSHDDSGQRVIIRSPLIHCNTPYRRRLPGHVSLPEHLALTRFRARAFHRHCSGTGVGVGCRPTCNIGGALSKTRLDESRWPLVIFTAVGEQTEDDFEAYLEDCDRVLARRERHSGIFDARRADPIGPKLRKRQVQWLERNDGLLRAYLVGTGMVMNSAIQRGVFRAILWMRPLPVPYCVETSLEAARRFVCLRKGKSKRSGRRILPRRLRNSHSAHYSAVSRSYAGRSLGEWAPGVSAGSG